MLLGNWWKRGSHTASITAWINWMNKLLIHSIISFIQLATVASLFGCYGIKESAKVINVNVTLSCLCVSGLNISCAMKSHSLAGTLSAAININNIIMLFAKAEGKSEKQNKNIIVY